MEIAGIRPVAPGFAKAEIRPQLGDLADLELTTHTPRGPIVFRAEAQEGAPRVGDAARRVPGGAGASPVTEGKGVAVTDADRALGLERSRSPPAQTTEFDVPASRHYREALEGAASLDYWKR